MKQLQKCTVIAVVGLATGTLAQTGPGSNNSTSEGDQPAHLGQATVVATNLLKEELLLGENQQPEWTARRRFITTRVYVQPPWQFEAEFGYDGSYGNVGKPMHLLQQEIELGLPYRFQVDFENVFQNFKEGDDETRKWKHESNSIEVRYAFADWGRIFLNPTVNLEWRFNDGAADAGEVNLLQGEEFGKGWHWGLNFFYEQQIGDDRVREFAFSQGISYTLIDSKLSAGVEMKFSSESDKDSRSDPENKFQIGPSFQWRPTRRTHLDIVPLFGCTSASPTAEIFIFFGFEFGKGAKEPEGVSPASLRGK